ncbi:MAG: hypothetical protein F4X55_02595 [Candidatus Dadabacteria bacterium]|nr:hypothetical protein [Candidatus Dadabacteria bacterium]
MNDDFKEYIDALRHRLEELSTPAKILEENSGIRQIVEQANRNQELIRTVFSPIQELRQSGFFNATVLPDFETQRILNTVATIERRFCLPEIAEVPKLFLEFENSGLTNVIKRYQRQTSELQRAMECMRTPWFDVENRLDSIAGFVKLQNIGQVLRTMPTFDQVPTDVLRERLGDWRDKISWPDDIFTDPFARSSFYVERGLDSTLTAFLPEAFEESISIAGLNEPLQLVQDYDFQLEVETYEEELAFKRTNAAHNRFQRFETQLRKFIDEKMKAEFGDNWSRHQMHGEVRKQWVEKQEKARDTGEAEKPLISYADFTDYEPIITRKDNWNRVFKSVFKRKTSVQESFQRLYPIRICTMHSRPITQDDELYLCAETTRILNAIEVLSESR